MTTTFPDVTISTDRLVLRAFEEEDVTALAEMMNDEHITAWTSVPHPYTHAEAHAWATRHAHAERTEGRGIVFAVTEFLTQRLVGIVHLQNTNWHTRTTEVGYVTAPWARGEGYASESVLAVAQWLFRDRNFERLELRTAADNTASQQVAQKIGCISEGVLRNAWIVRAQTADGGWTETRTDLIVWSLVPEDLDEMDDSDGYDGYEVHGNGSGRSGHPGRSGDVDQYAYGRRADAGGYAVGADWH
ncbi:GNAT family N-acetyltransferase [Streptomyces sp. NPDC048383]|uniref:GNAT family N-acetyltransferase n=1 Tax=Streptomyces sp. NPDC048383 TaxID=3155386 RepID=UPI00341C1402